MGPLTTQTTTQAACPDVEDICSGRASCVHLCPCPYCQGLLPPTPTPATLPVTTPTAPTTPKVACTTVVCTMDVCPDGRSRRRIGDDCCSCETFVTQPTSPSTTQTTTQAAC